MLEYALQSGFVSVAFPRQQTCTGIIWTISTAADEAAPIQKRLAESSPALSAGLMDLFRRSAALTKALSFHIRAGSRPAEQLRICLQGPVQKAPQLVLLRWEQGQ